jgi:hypothetical protein
VDSFKEHIMSDVSLELVPSEADKARKGRSSRFPGILGALQLQKRYLKSTRSSQHTKPSQSS